MRTERGDPPYRSVGDEPRAYVPGATGKGGVDEKKEKCQGPGGGECRGRVSKHMLLLPGICTGRRGRFKMPKMRLVGDRGMKPKKRRKEGGEVLGGEGRKTRRSKAKKLWENVNSRYTGENKGIPVNAILNGRHAGERESREPSRV